MGFNEVLTIMINSLTLEIFVIISCYTGYVILLPVPKSRRRRFFIIYSLEMLLIHIPQVYLKYCAYDIKNVELIIFFLTAVNCVINYSLFKVMSDRDFLHIFLADMIACIFASALCFTVLNAAAGAVGESASTLFSLDFELKNTVAYIAALLIMSCGIALERFLLQKYLSGFCDINVRPKWLWWGVIVIYQVSGPVVTALSGGNVINIVVMIFMTIFAILAFFEISWWARSRREKRIKKENQALSVENTVMKEYYDTISLQMEQTRKFRHDIEKHMSTLNEMIKSRGNSEEVMEYAAQIEERYENLDTIDYCGNPVFNAILVNKKYECENGGIELEISVGRFDPGRIRELDLVAVFSNLLDRAIEGCKAVKDGTGKRIDFKCGRQNGMFTVNVAGSFAEDKTRKESKPASAKRRLAGSERESGDGLWPVKEIANQYGGIFAEEVRGRIREITVSLPAE